MQFTSFFKALSIAIVTLFAVAQANPVNGHSDSSAAHAQGLFRSQLTGATASTFWIIFVDPFYKNYNAS
ncbi:hypothetical protein BJ085DRAFT_39164 [Dimargaris cristalligena]|uniref:Uncharacterized protein n=1 Tax=Dimargaris cristalligena TaxID=215637 RepID=A0A4P9ZM88_9FUNG|nr:hypothetical protein BJ085DRAFT_39164 [Dimargaris cristalligena]|eukprot:RKP34444.1 hypothetical protein BJ085DRAFT_39164 [Dimargaris cristalligena]